MALTQPKKDPKPFNLMALPAELRDEVYRHACAPFPPIDLASIADTADRVKVPAIAQLNRETRAEVLAVFFRGRPLIISLNCSRNSDRALAWLESIGEMTELGSTIVIIGRGSKLGPGETYRITVHCSAKEPHFRVEHRPGASRKSEEASRRICQGVERFLARKTDALEGRLTAKQMKVIVAVVMHFSGDVTPLQDRRGR